MVKVFDLKETSLKFERHCNAMNVDIEVWIFFKFASMYFDEFYNEYTNPRSSQKTGKNSYCYKATGPLNSIIPLAYIIKHGFRNMEGLWR